MTKIVKHQFTDSCKALKLVPREFWNAKPVELEETGPAKVVYVNMTNTGEYDSDSEWIGMMMYGLQEDAFRAGLPDINYNFVIGYAGNVFVGRDFNKTASLLDRDEDEKTNSLIIAIFGSQSPKLPPPPRAMIAVMNVLTCGMDNGSIRKDVKIRHVDQFSDPCEGSLGQRIQRLIVSTYGPGTTYYPSFECISE